MSIRILAVSLFLLPLASAPFVAFAGDYPSPCQGKECQNPQQPLPPPHHPHPAPVPAPACGFCDGVYDGSLCSQPGQLSLEIHQLNASGEIEVIGWWGGATWYGRGICRQIAPWQAQIEFQYPYTAVQRGVVNTNGYGAAEIDGRVDGGDSFHLVRRGW